VREKIIMKQKNSLCIQRNSSVEKILHKEAATLIQKIT
jgi:hypothetical protein